MVNFYKNTSGIGTIQFASGEVVALSDDVDVKADNTTNQIVISEFKQDKFWISIAQELQVNGVAITGTNQHKADLIAPVFASDNSGGTTTIIQEVNDLTVLTDPASYDIPSGYSILSIWVLPSSDAAIGIGSAAGLDDIEATDTAIASTGKQYVMNLFAKTTKRIYFTGLPTGSKVIIQTKKVL